MNPLRNPGVAEHDGHGSHEVPNWDNPIETWLSEKPVQALLIALASGVVLGWLIKRT